jgi:DNA-binding winged helix-turn-helix (wHTH) protein/tetratricopeptide (TPR) repeat protein
LLYFFGNYVLDSDRRELHRGSAPVPVEPQVFDVLLHLIRHREHVVSRDELLAEIWQGRIVSEATLSSRINAARSAVGDNGEQQRVIRTVPRRGFRFVGAVREHERGAATFELAQREPSDGANQRAPSIASSEPPPAPTVDAGGERRQLTVLSCELIGSAMPLGRMDPEDLRDLADAFHRWLTDTVARFGGFVGRRAGTTVVVFFGYPAADEDDAEQAVRTALELCTSVDGFNPDAGYAWQCRVGIATGLVVVADRAVQTPRAEPVGEAVNMAAQLQISAPPNEVLIEENTKRLIGNLFDCREIAPFGMTGAGGLRRAWQILAASRAESRFEALHARPLSPLVGRDEERDTLLRRWRQAARGEGRVVLIAGEPGIGKSRLVLALQEAIESEPHMRVRYFCSPHHADSALFPFVSQLERAARFEREDSRLEKTAKLNALLSHSSADPQSVALLADLLSLPLDERSKLSELTPQKRKEKTLAAFLSQLEGLACPRPVLVIFEDLHWIDPTSLELLALTVERIRSLPVLMVLTYRPEFESPWTGQSNVTLMSLSRLGTREGTALVQHVSGDRMLPRRIVDEIVERTDGIPLFLEELTKVILESGTDEAEKTISAVPSAALGVPATLQALLMARLDRLGPAKRMAQIGAAIGREFFYELIAAVAPQSGAELSSQLDRLVGSGLIFRRGVPPQATYLFKHSLVQDAAYGTLLREARRELHASIAKALRENFPETLDAQPEIVAHHFSEAGELDKAIAYWVQAGQLASLRSAHAEAFSHLKKGLELLSQLPDTRERDRRELSLRTALGAVYVATKGYSAAETVATYKRATELLQATGDMRPRLAIHNGLLVGYYNLAQFDSGLDLAQDTLGQGERDDDDAAICVGHRMIAAVCNSIGEFEQAAYHARRGWDLYQPEHHGLAVLGLVHDTGLGAKLHLALALCQLGFQRQAKQVATEALSLAAELRHVNSIGYAWFFGGIMVNFIGRDHSALTEYASRLRAYAHQHGMPQWAAYGRAFGVVPLVISSGACAAVDEITAAICDCERIQNFVFRPAHLTILASAELAAGRSDQALAAIARALETAERTREHWLTAETWRVRGHVLLSIGRSERSEECFQHALAIARSQSARLFQLRAAVSLARLWRDQGKRSEALNLIAPIYGWFTEGFDTPDLKEAKALLEELA